MSPKLTAPPSGYQTRGVLVAVRILMDRHRLIGRLAFWWSRSAHHGPAYGHAGVPTGRKHSHRLAGQTARTLWPPYLGEFAGEDDPIRPFRIRSDPASLNVLGYGRNRRDQVVIDLHGAVKLEVEFIT